MGKGTKYQPAAQDNILVSLLHLHSFKHILSSLLRPVAKEQFYDLPKTLKPADTYKTYLRTKTTFTLDLKTDNLPWVLLKAFKVQFIFATLLTVIATLLAMAGPMLMKKVIYFLEKKKVIPAQFSVALNYLLIWVGLYLLKLLIGEIGDKVFFNIGLKVDEALIEDITRKIARLPSTIKNHIPKAELINYVMIDVKLVGYFFKYITHGLTAPTVLIVGTFMTLSSGQPYSILMALTLMAVVLLLKIISEFMYRKKREKLRYQYQRLNSNTELVEQIKELRQLGYEDLIVNRTRFFRQKQNAVNFMLYCLTYLYDTVLAVIPLLIIGFVFLKQQFDISDKTISAAELYAIFNYSTLITYPLKYLRSFYNSTHDMFFALRRLEDFLMRPEVDITFPFLKQELEPGELAIQNLAIVEHPLEDKHHYLFEGRRKEYLMKGEVTLPMTLQLKRGDKITVLSRRGEGRILLEALGGQINIREGRVSYGGTMMYSPSRPWFFKGTIASNITYSLLAESEKLTIEQVTSICDLDGELANLPDGLLTELADINPLSYSALKKLQLARYLYANPDIMLLDDPFKGMEQGAAETILRNIKSKLNNRTIIISCNCPELLSPTDAVLVFHENKTAAFGQVQQLLQDPHSIIHTFLHENQRQIENFSPDKRQSTKQQNNSSKKKEPILHNEEHKPHQQHKEHHEQQHQDGAHGHHDHYEVHGNHREPRVPFKKYWKLFTASHSRLIIVAVAFLVLAQLSKGYANWWVSHISHHHGKIKLKQQLSNTNIFIRVTVIFALIHFIEGIISAYLYKANSDSFSEYTMKSLAKSDMSFFESHDLIVVALKSNKDFEDTFTISYYFQTVLRNLLLYIVIFGSVAMENPEFTFIGLTISGFGIFVYLNFSRAERQIMRYFTPTYEDSQKEFQQFIDGLQTVKPLGTAKVEKLRRPWDIRTNDLFVIRLNEKYIYQALNIACELFSMLMPFLPALYAVFNKKSLSEHQLHAFLTIIIYSTKLCGMMTSLTKDAAYVQNIMRLSIKKNLDIMDLPPQKDLPTNDDPYWPRSSDLALYNVTVGNDKCKSQELKDVRVDFVSGERVLLIGKQAEGLSALKEVIAQGSKWEEEKGEIVVAGASVKSIAHKHYIESVMHLTPTPFIFTGTLRENIDPFNEYRDKAILKAISSFNLESLMTSSTERYAKLNILNQRVNFEDAPTPLKNSINIVRAILRQPAVVVCDNITPNQCQVSAQHILATKLAESTIIFDTASVTDALKASKILVFSKGQVVEEGTPNDLLDRQSHFKEYVNKNPVYSGPVFNTE